MSIRNRGGEWEPLLLGIEPENCGVCHEGLYRNLTMLRGGCRPGQGCQGEWRLGRGLQILRRDRDELRRRGREHPADELLQVARRQPAVWPGRSGYGEPKL